LYDGARERSKGRSPLGFWDRSEVLGIRDREAALVYVNTLLETVAQDRYPSPPMLNRITRLLDSL
jgi:hypothetical protein